VDSCSKSLTRKDNPLVILEDARAGCGRALLFRSPSGALCACSPAEVRPALEEVERALAAGKHVAGYFSYELGYLLEPRLTPLLYAGRRVPLLWLGIFERCEALSETVSETLFADLGRAFAGPLELEWSAREYTTRFDRLHELISAGDLYQANLSFRAGFNFAGDPRALYCDLRRYSQAGYCAYVDDGERGVLSLSPELFFEISAAGLIRTRPMKGTAARGVDAASDTLARARLVASDKDRAENLMIVDLLRNDLTRVAELGSVRVDNLFEVETYPTLHQLVSTISARRARNSSASEILRTLFPSGSVTGAPKIRAMEVIRELEASPRGIYCGAIGAFHPDGSARFNVAIRTLTISGNRGELGIGSGVVHNSSSGSEYAECLLKARHYEAARTPLQLIETLRFDPAGPQLVRETRHLERMACSAAFFGLAFDRDRAREVLAEAAEGTQTALRVRLTLSEEGRLAASASPFVPATSSEWCFVVADVRVSSADVFLFHKTGRRGLFESELARAARDWGADEVLFLNERGELTEGSRTNIFVEIDGTLLTPPLHCGLLGGCLRQELLATGQCKEAVLCPEDLARAEAVYLGNSLRGLVRAVPVKDRTSRTDVGKQKRTLTGERHAGEEDYREGCEGQAPGKGANDASRRIRSRGNSQDPRW
jgi:para-aminobenzoate synthetase / 4-amino-4-deoxychorismate lyase